MRTRLATLLGALVLALTGTAVGPAHAVDQVADTRACTTDHGIRVCARIEASRGSLRATATARDLAGGRTWHLKVVHIVLGRYKPGTRFDQSVHGMRVPVGPQAPTTVHATSPWQERSWSFNYLARVEIAWQAGGIHHQRWFGSNELEARRR